jgi:hypothetical protein
VKRGIEILISWLVVTILVATFIAPNIPLNGFTILCDHLTVASFPLAAWFYARHSDRISPIIAYGLIAGIFSIFVPLHFFYDSRGMSREISIDWKIAVVGVPILMALLCVGIFTLRRFLDRDDGHHDT